MRRKKLIIGDAIDHKSKVERLNYKNNRSLTGCTNGSRNTSHASKCLSQLYSLIMRDILLLLSAHFHTNQQQKAKTQSFPHCSSHLVSPANFHHSSLSETSATPSLTSSGCINLSELSRPHRYHITPSHNYLFLLKSYILFVNNYFLILVFNLHCSSRILLRQIMWLPSRNQSQPPRFISPWKIHSNPAYLRVWLWYILYIETFYHLVEGWIYGACKSTSRRFLG